MQEPIKVAPSTYELVKGRLEDLLLLIEANCDLRDEQSFHSIVHDLVNEAQEIWEQSNENRT